MIWAFAHHLLNNLDRVAVQGQVDDVVAVTLANFDLLFLVIY
jgi:hypothetical protein